MLKKSCIDTFDAISCGAAALFCNEELQAPLMKSGERRCAYSVYNKQSEQQSQGKNPYDISKDCEGKLEETICYSATKYPS